MDDRGVTRRDLLTAAGAAGVSALASGVETSAAEDRNNRAAQTDSVIKTLFHVNPDKKMAEQAVPGHNRIHPDVPAVVEVRPGDAFRVECQEWTDNQVGNNDSAEDVAKYDLHAVHMLSGPFHVVGAEPGDLLAVDILDIGPLRSWGYTGIFSKANGGGFLTDHYPDAHKAVWNFQGVYATSRHLPGVKFVGISHPGQIVTAPSEALINQWNRREAALIATDPNRVPPLAYSQSGQYALAGTAKGAVKDKIIREGARSVPPRESGGNIDIKNLTRGARIYLPVHVEGARHSIGDLHFSQGDGEITFCGAIEMAGWVEIGLDLIQRRNEEIPADHADGRPGPARTELPRLPLLHRHLGEGRRHANLPRRQRLLPQRLPGRHPLPEHRARLLGAASVSPARGRADRRPGGRHR